MRISSPQDSHQLSYPCLEGQRPLLNDWSWEVVWHSHMAVLGNGAMLGPARGLGDAELHEPPPHMDQGLLIFIGLYTVY